MTDAIEVSGLVKAFGAHRALDGLDLSVRVGEVHGFLGPNGAGKSTTIRVLLGLLRADAGDLLLLGGDPWRDARTLHARLAYAPGDVTLWPTLTGGQIIDILGSLRGAPPDERRRTELIERFRLDPTKRSSTYSKGNRQKVALVDALAADVELLILDEPTSGLDPLMERVFAECVAEARERGQTILLSSHILSEVERLCDRVTILREGQTVRAGSLDDLRRDTRTSVTAHVDAVPGGLAQLVGVHDVQYEDGTLTCELDAAALGPAMRLISDASPRSLAMAPPSLESLFLRMYQRDGADGADDDAAAGDGAALAVSGGAE